MGDTASTTAVVDSATKMDSARAVAIPAPAADSAMPAADSAAAGTGAKTAIADSTKAAVAIPPADSSVQDTAKGQPARKKRKRIVRETTVNTIDELKGQYRSPKKALFMSLVVPGLGQAYVGQHWVNYARGATYLLTDVGLAFGWRHYVVTKQDRQIARYRRFADRNWRLYQYEDSLHRNDKGFDVRNPHRETYCQSVQSNQGSGSRLYTGCVEPDLPQNESDYQAFADAQSDKGLTTDSISRVRAQFPNVHNFYELIGKEVEFVTGWADVGSVPITITDSSFNQIRDGKVVTATTDLQQEYIGMRAKANDYARMQAYFLGGMVLNHIVSALDAAFAAHFHNKGLYQTEVGFWDRVQFDSYMAWEGFAPKPTISASLTF